MPVDASRSSLTKGRKKWGKITRGCPRLGVVVVRGTDGSSWTRRFSKKHAERTDHQLRTKGSKGGIPQLPMQIETARQSPGSWALIDNVEEGEGKECKSLKPSRGGYKRTMRRIKGLQAPPSGQKTRADGSCGEKAQGRNQEKRPEWGLERKRESKNFVKDSLYFRLQLGWDKGDKKMTGGISSLSVGFS